MTKQEHVFVHAQNLYKYVKGYSPCASQAILIGGSVNVEIDAMNNFLQRRLLRSRGEVRKVFGFRPRGGALDRL